MVEPGMDEVMDPEAMVDIPVDMPMDFAGGARVTDLGDEGAL